MFNDPIADLLTRLRNAYGARHTEVTIPHSEMKYAILKILEKHKFILGIKVDKVDNIRKNIIVDLQEIEKGEIKPSFKRISKPGRRVYIKSSEIKPVNSGFGIAILSTPKGLMSSYEAKTAGVGGEYLCEVF